MSCSGILVLRLCLRYAAPRDLNRSTRKAVRGSCSELLGWIRVVLVWSVTNALLASVPADRAMRLGQKLVFQWQGGANHRRRLSPTHPCVKFITQNTRFRFGAVFNHALHSVYSLSFTSSRPHPPQQLVHHLTHLELGNSFNQSLEHLPRELTHLKLGSPSSFRRPLAGLPPRLTHLTMDVVVLVPGQLEGLPPSLTHLTVKGIAPLGFSLDKLPDRLIELNLFMYCYRNPFGDLLLNAHLFPVSLEVLRLKGGFADSLETFDHLPKLRILELTNWSRGQSKYLVSRLPPSLQCLRFKNGGSLELDQSLNNLQTSCLTQLEFGPEFNLPVDRLPRSLTHLTLGYRFNQPVDCLPPKLTHLTICSDSALRAHQSNDFNQPLDRLPAGLLYLSIGGGSKFDHPVNDVLPAHLVILRLLGFVMNHPIQRIPPSVKLLLLHPDWKGPHPFSLPAFDRWSSSSNFLSVQWWNIC